MAGVKVLLTNLILWSSLWCPGEAGNIIIFHPVYAGSHTMILKDLGEHLIARGHSVTQIRFKNKQNPGKDSTNVTQIDLSVVPYTDAECRDYISPDGEIDINISATKLLWRDGESVYKIPGDVFCVTRAHCHSLFNVHTAKLKRIMERGAFDLAVVDLIANECGLAMARSLNVPVVGFWMFSYQGGETLRSPVFNPPSLVPGFLSGLPPSPMNFLQRVYNFIVYLTHEALLFIQESIADEFIEKRFPALPSVRRMLFDLDFTFVHTNFLVDSPKLMAPNSKYVGGIHLRPPRELSHDLKAFVEGGTKGVILFSLGLSGYSPDTVPISFIHSLMLIFSELVDYRIIMRFDSSCIQSPIPENVMVLKWIPQQDLLAHPNVKLFINHGGMAGIQESVYHGVPMVFIPIFGDQNDNAARLEAFGMGLTVIKSQLSYQTLKYAISEVLFNEKYTLKTRYFMNLWREEWISSKEETTHWIELLLKYNHLDHLKIQGSNQSLFIYFSLDVILFLALLFVVVTLLLGYIIYIFFGKSSFVYETKRKSH